MVLDYQVTLHKLINEKALNVHVVSSKQKLIIFHFVPLIGPSFGPGLLQYKLVLAKDAVKANGTYPKTAEYINECQHPEALDPFVVQGSIVICTFAEGFNNGTSSIVSIIETARTLGCMGFVFLANSSFGDFIAESIPLTIPGILIPKVTDAQVRMHWL